MTERTPPTSAAPSPPPPAAQPPHTPAVEHELTVAGLEPRQECRARALEISAGWCTPPPHLSHEQAARMVMEIAELYAAYVADGSRP